MNGFPKLGWPFKIKFGHLALHLPQSKCCVLKVLIQRKLSHCCPHSFLIRHFHLNVTAAMFQTSSVGVEPFSYVKSFFCSNNLHSCWSRERKRSKGRSAATTGTTTATKKTILLRMRIRLFCTFLCRRCTTRT